MEDKLTDFERAEYYKEKLKTQIGFTVIMAVLMFVLGFVVSRALYLTIWKPC